MPYAGMRRAYAADISIIDNAVGLMVDALARKGVLKNTWIIYTSDHGEMARSHGLMSKCVMYQQAVRVPLIIRPPGGRRGTVVDSLVEQLDVPATVRAIAGAPPVTHSEGHSLVASVREGTPGTRAVAVSENWGFAMFETDRYKLVVDEDSCSPCQLFDLEQDPEEDTNLVLDPQSADAVEQMMDTHVRPSSDTPPAPAPEPVRPQQLSRYRSPGAGCRACACSVPARLRIVVAGVL